MRANSCTQLHVASVFSNSCDLTLGGDEGAASAEGGVVSSGPALPKAAGVVAGGGGSDSLVNLEEVR